jgi:hypothetical protein
MPSTWVKDPNTIIDRAVNWVNWLATGDSLATKTVTADSGLTVDSSAISGTSVTARLSGGTVGKDYNVLYRITTTLGESDDQTITIKIRQK